MVIYSVTGWSGSGKTTLISELTRRFSLKGMSVLVVKKVANKYHLEPEGKDSFQFLKAGASDSIILASGELLRISSINSAEEGFEIVEKEFSNYDLVLLEGVRSEKIATLEVFDSSLGKGMKIEASALEALVTDDEVELNIPIFRRDDIESIVKFMEENRGKKSCS